MFGESWLSTFWRVFRPIDFNDFPENCRFARNVTYTMVWWTNGLAGGASRGWFWAETIIFKAFGRCVKIGLEGDSDAPESGQFGEMLHFQFCFILLWFLNDFGVLEGSTSCILLILHWFYWCLVKVDVDVLRAWFWGLSKDQNLEISWFQKCFIFLANIENSMLSGCNLEGRIV